jgi:hypothetical protein
LRGWRLRCGARRLPLLRRGETAGLQRAGVGVLYVAGLGYGQPLTVRGLSRGQDAVFASEAPSAAAPEAPHEVRVRTVKPFASGVSARVAI